VVFSASTARFAPRWAHSHEFHFCPCEECNLRYYLEVVIKLLSPAQAGFFCIWIFAFSSRLIPLGLQFESLTGRVAGQLHISAEPGAAICRSPL
jgi:hypothetical protein